jgi:protein AaeX
MRYTEINIFGVYVAPFAAMMLGAWIVTIPLRRLFDWSGLLRHVWHPSLFNAAIYTIVLSIIALAVGRGWV